MLALDERTDRLIAAVSAKTGKPPLDVVREGVEAVARAAGVVASVAPMKDETLVERMRALSDAAAALPRLTSRSADELVDYGSDGVPR